MRQKLFKNVHFLTFLFLALLFFNNLNHEYSYNIHLHCCWGCSNILAASASLLFPLLDSEWETYFSMLPPCSTTLSDSTLVLLWTSHLLESRSMGCSLSYHIDMQFHWCKRSPGSQFKSRNPCHASFCPTIFHSAIQLCCWSVGNLSCSTPPSTSDSWNYGCSSSSSACICCPLG